MHVPARGARVLAVVAVLASAWWLAARPAGGTEGGSYLPVAAEPPPAPADNPTTPERAALGRYLFYDVRLSGPGYMSCGTCHRPELGFTDGRPVAIGITGQRHPHNTPGLANVGYFRVLTWADPAQTLLEEQSATPLFGTDPIEMMAGGRQADILARLRIDAGYRQRFLAAFPDTGGTIDFPAIRMALAAFQRTLISADTAYDRHLRDPASGALDAAALRGLALFESDRLACAVCHVPPHFTDAAGAPRFHNTGLYNLDGAGAYPDGNRGLIEHSGAPADMGRFRTPSLRNVAITAPYMHDGSIATLDAVITHYAAGGRAALTGPPSPLVSPDVRGFALSEAERRDLLAFLEALTDSTFLTDERLQSPYRWGGEGGPRAADQRRP
ncbi:MAG: di-heme enzyme [Rhodospirillaceae bacterium]|nr:di-heme enzyme [Rhodospirillaceae bacterium]